MPAPGARVLRPQSVVQGKRVRAGPRETPRTRGGKHKAKPAVGKGEYVKAPLLRDKLTQPHWLANAAVNNPGNVLAGAGVGGGLGILAGSREKVRKDDRKKNAAAGALIGGGAGQLARVGADYGSKELSEHQLKPLTNKGPFGPYKDSPHKATLRAHEKAAGKAGRAAGPGKAARAKATYFDEHFPKGVPSYRARKVGIALNKKPVMAGAVLGGAALGAGVGATHKVKKSGRLMSDAEIRRRKKIQSHNSIATGALGLTALGGTLAASRGGRTALRKIPQLQSKIKAPGPKDPNRDRLKGAVTPVLATSAGLSGVGSFNFASYTNAESRKRGMQKPKTTTSKRVEDDMDMGYYGEEGRPIEFAPIPREEVTKAWSPSASNFDSERSRRKRSKTYEGGALVGAGASGAYAGHHGMKAVHGAKALKPKDMTEVKDKVVNAAGDVRKVPNWTSSGHVHAEKAVSLSAAKPAFKSGGKAALGVAGVAAAAGAHKEIKRRRKGHWQPYAQ